MANQIELLFEPIVDESFRRATKYWKNGYKFPECSCLDSAYERKAIDEGMNGTPVFPENIKYLEELRRSFE